MKHRKRVEQNIWKIEADKKLDLAIIETGLRLASLQVAQGTIPETASLLLKSIDIYQNKTTISFTGNKKTVDLFSKILAASMPDIKSKSSEI